ncbi:MAG: methionyl-tRNA formyltransferase [Bacteroidetes bacterium RBG_19FT_COMBO_42_7]|jgi:methionyl-tRNA formyltransferase|nr:MAG: methionyl-tRNA formyltransferase [Bacteroidetes bacterium RBG_19FT_COMBO_42_7]
MKSLRVVFMGTPEFAIAPLGSLLMNGYNVVAVVTSPDKPAGRGRIFTKSAVKLFSESNYLPLLQPDNLKNPVFIERLRRLNADVFVVVAFRMLPEEVWKIPPKGTINLHASLLPQYRGAAPINHVIINGETATGVTTFLIDNKIDNGNILLRQEVTVFPFENAGDLHDKLMKHGARLVIKTLEAIAGSWIKPQPQSEFMIPGEILKPAPKISPDYCIIDWNHEPVKIHNFIRGLAPNPCARSVFKNEKKSISFKIYESQPETEKHLLQPGKIVSDGKNFIKITCAGGFIRILNLQIEGKKRLNTEEFLRGFLIDEFVVPVN